MNTHTPKPQHTILVVDDEPINISVLSNILKPYYRILAARSGQGALDRLNQDAKPDLILLDIMMPEMDGLSVCKTLKSNPETADIPVIFITAMAQESDEFVGFNAGAVDYITKPVIPPIVLARVSVQLELLDARRQLAQQNQILEERVKERTREVAMTQEVTIYALASLAETRDNETGNHIRRTQHYIKSLALALRSTGGYPQLTDEVIDLMYKSAPLHDIGKVGIPDHILLKPGKLTDDEFEIMKTHATLGGEAIQRAEAEFGEVHTSFLSYAREIATCHHERWGGTGYPRGLKGEDIPLAGRLMALADVFDALISERVYKPPFSYEKAHELITKGNGTHFDPNVVDAFIAIEHEFIEIAERFKDQA